MSVHHFGLKCNFSQIMGMGCLIWLGRVMIIQQMLYLPCMCHHFGILAAHSPLCLLGKLRLPLDDPHWSVACGPAGCPAGSP